MSDELRDELIGAIFESRFDFEKRRPVGIPMDEYIATDILPIIAREVAAALKEAADAIDLEAIATEWAGSDGSGHWSAGNAASEIRIQLHDRASHIERVVK